MSHSLRRRRASSLAASSLSFCCRMRLSTISVYLLSALALHVTRQVRIRRGLYMNSMIQSTWHAEGMIDAQCCVRQL